MLDPRLESHELHGSHDTLERIRRVAEYGGQALAMVNSLYALGQPKRVPIWEAEASIWQKRQSEIINQAPLGAAYLEAYASQVRFDAFVSGFIKQVETPRMVSSVNN